MSRLVQKFGGTSVADVAHIFKAAEIACQAQKDGHQVTTVVSAMGHTTDNLISLAQSVQESPPERELDMLMATGEQVSIALMSMAIQSLGGKAKSFTGPQAGIITEPNFGQARIKAIRPQALEACLAEGEIAVVAGFQGATETNELTTLGRGGSDTTATALASALHAKRCDIYSDVTGVYTADPAQVTDARKLTAISYEEMLELASCGAKVLNARSVETARDGHIPLRVRSTFEPSDPGTLITHHYLSGSYTVCGIACDTTQDWFRLVFNQTTTPNADKLIQQSQSQLFKLMQEMGISTDAIQVLTREEEHTQEICFSASKTVSARIRKVIGEFDGTISKIKVEKDLAKVSIVGRGLASNSSHVAQVFDCLMQNEIPLAMMTTSDLTVNMLVPLSSANTTVKLLHKRLLS